MRCIMHYDMDAFFASVEIREQPRLKGKALVVGRTIVTTASYEAREYGIHSAMTVMEARKRCPSLLVVGTSKEKYMRYSAYIHSLVEELTSVVEYISLDEGFLDITDLIDDYPSKEFFAKKFKERIHARTGLTCSVGMGYNKLTAKIASDIHKPNGYYIFHGEEDFQAYVADKKLKILPGVGKKFFEELEADGILYAKDVYPLSFRELASRYGTSRAYLLYYYSRGIDDRPVKQERKSLSIGNEQSYHPLLEGEGEIEREYRDLFQKSYLRMKKKGYLCKNIQIKIRYSDFQTITRSKHLQRATDEEQELFALLQELMEEVEYRDGLRLLGVSFGRLLKREMVREQLRFPF